MVVLLADAATPSAATYGIVFDQCTLTVLAGVYTSIVCTSMDYAPLS